MKCLVELVRERSIGDAAEVVVRLDVLLEGLTTVVRDVNISQKFAKPCRRQPRG